MHASFRHLTSFLWVGALLLPVFAPRAQPAPTVSTVASFLGNNGAKPYGQLWRGTDGNLYGTTFEGGANNQGAIFRTTPSGLVTLLVSFDRTNNGAQPYAGLVRDSTTGNFYGTTSAGGANDDGTAFMMTPAGSLTTLVSFGGANGAQPYGRLLAATNGNFTGPMLFGTTLNGGQNDLGTIFLVTAAGDLSTLFSFDGTATGAHPAAGLVLSTNGSFYGVTRAGGTNGAGSIFRFSVTISSSTPPLISTSFTNLYSFTGGTNGLSPQAELTFGVPGGNVFMEGDLYGTTAGGGAHDKGTVFSITHDGLFATVASFDQTNGASPYGKLLRSSGGGFTGTTLSGGTNDSGTVFDVGTDGTITTLYEFTGKSDGGSPYAGLTVGTNGTAYGVTFAGGKNGLGTIYGLPSLPFILNDPAALVVTNGDTASFTVLAGGSAPLRYQWQLNSTNLVNGSRISGATSTNLVVIGVTAADAGTYSVVVTNAFGSVTSAGADLAVRVQPIVRITSPSRNSVVKKAVITVKGTASGNADISQVHYQLNGTFWFLATPSGGWSNWTAKVTLPSGTNTVQAYAEDINGFLSRTDIVSFVCGITSAPVVVNVNGDGSVSPNYNGQPLEIGKSFTMTAKAGRSSFFSNWTDGADVVLTNMPRLSFVMESNLVLNANFVLNPFYVERGTYTGLFFDTNGVAPESSGFFTVTTTDKAKFSGKLQIGAARYSMKGGFDTNNGLAQFTLSPRNLPPLDVLLQLDLSLTNRTDQITGSVSDRTWTSDLIGYRPVFDGRTNVAPQAGQYTMIIPGNSDSAAAPGGDSYGTLTISTSGKLRFAGALADGTKLSQSVPLSMEGLWPFYGSLYGGQGSILGWLLCTNTTPSTNASSGDVTGSIAWFKPPAVAKAKFYTSGFTVMTNVMGSSYTRPLTGEMILDLPAGNIMLTGGNLTDTITDQITIDSRNRVTDISGNKLVLTFSVSAGTFSGSLANPAVPKPIPFKGVVLQKNGTANGFFLGTDQSGQVLLKP